MGGSSYNMMTKLEGSHEKGAGVNRATMGGVEMKGSKNLKQT